MAVAAVSSVGSERNLHSLHVYYLAPGRTDGELRYDVTELRDGVSVSARRVEARQSGRLISTMLCLLAEESHAGPGHQANAPHAPDPESLPTVGERRRLSSSEPDGFVTPPAADWRLGRVPIDIRYVGTNTGTSGQRMFWFRAESPAVDTGSWHRIILAYLSDHSLLSAVLAIRGELASRPSYRVASLDHSVWFHQPFRVDDWLLYVQDSPASSGSYGMARGLVFARNGVLVASTAQEGHLSRRPAEPG